MVKLKGPLFSQSASGAIRKRLTYSTRRSGNQVRFQRAQEDVITSKRTTQRGYYQDAINGWNSLSDAEKAQWDVFNNS